MCKPVEPYAPHAPQSEAMANPDRLTGLDASFLALRGGRRPHARGLRAALRGRRAALRGVRRAARAAARARAALPPEARLPAAGPEPAGVGRRPALQRRLPRAPHRAARRPPARRSSSGSPGRVFAQRLDRAKPLWELWLVDRVGDGPLRADRQDPPLPRRRHLRRRHHDGALRPRARSAARRSRPSRGCRGPSPRSATLLADALAERAVDAARARPRRGRRADAARPGATVRRAPRPRSAWPRSRARGSAAPRARPLNGRIGPHRRFAWVDADLATLKAIKNALGGTVNDVVLAAVAGALRTYHLAHGWPTADGAARDGARLRPRGRRARRARQQGLDDLRAAADRPRRPDRALPRRARGDAAASRSPGRPSARR